MGRPRVYDMKMAGPWILRKSAGIRALAGESGSVTIWTGHTCRLGADRRFCYAEGYCAIAHNAGEHSLAIESEAGDITVLLREWTAGDAEACDRLMPHVYPHLREVATRL